MRERGNKRDPCLSILVQHVEVHRDASTHLRSGGAALFQHFGRNVRARAGHQHIKAHLAVLLALEETGVVRLHALGGERLMRKEEEGKGEESEIQGFNGRTKKK